MTYYDTIAKGYEELYREEQLNKLLAIKNNIKINKNTAKKLQSRSNG